jgi:hypothetical protein
VNLDTTRGLSFFASSLNTKEDEVMEQQEKKIYWMDELKHLAGHIADLDSRLSENMIELKDVWTEIRVHSMAMKGLEPYFKTFPGLEYRVGDDGKIELAGIVTDWEMYWSEDSRIRETIEADDEERWAESVMKNYSETQLRRLEKFSVLLDHPDRPF